MDQNEAGEGGMLFVPAGHDRFNERHGLAVSTIQLKVTPGDSAGLLVLENAFRAPGGPPRHLHPEQDEWFYVIEGEFVMEVGSQRQVLRAGDSLLAPRGVPHVWACAGDGHGRILVTFNPAGRMEAFFREVMKPDGLPPPDAVLWRSYGMELLGPPLPLS
jgi:quercetin dioxygenase-like cupin family protein